MPATSATGWQMQRLEELLAEVPAFAGMSDEHLELIAGCARNKVFADGERLIARARRPTSSSSSAWAAWPCRRTSHSAGRC